MKEFYLSGNNDGDFLRIKQYKKQEQDYTCFVEVGHCCVIIARHQIPTELFTNLFYDAICNADYGDIKEVVKNVMSDFSKSYVEERMSKVQKWDGYAHNENLTKE